MGNQAGGRERVRILRRNLLSALGAPFAPPTSFLGLVVDVRFAVLGLEVLEIDSRN